MGHVELIDGLELLDNSNSMFDEVDIYDNDSGEWYHGFSWSSYSEQKMDDFYKKFSDRVIKKMKGPEIFEAEVIVNDAA